MPKAGPPHDRLDDFAPATFSHDGHTPTVFRNGTGPGVVVISEIPGITPQVADFARHVVDAGFSVAMPDRFGDPGRPFALTRVGAVMARACISREFTARERVLQLFRDRLLTPA